MIFLFPNLKLNKFADTKTGKFIVVNKIANKD